MPDLPPVAERFLRYVRIDTQADPDSPSTPSTARQLDLSRLLHEELRALGLDADIDDYGYVYAHLPATVEGDLPTVGLLAHVDTSPDEPGGATPVVHRNYDGGPVTLPGTGAILSPEQQPALLDHVGHDLITSDGTTLLGSDDKAGVAVLMQLAADLIHSDAPRPPVAICFTVDEEIGRGVDKMDLEKFGADVAYTIDGSGMGAIEAETFHAAEAVLTIDGVMVHPGYAKGVMVNALRIVAEFIAALPAGEAPETTADAEGYFHPHTLDATPQHVRLKLLLRDFDADGMARRKRYVEQTADALRTKFPDAEITLAITDQYRNMRSYIEEKDPRAVTFALEAARAMGLEPRLERVRGGTDGARLSELGLPTPNVFNGGHDFHSRFEWNTVQNLETTLTYVHHLLARWAR